jgi:hypothetical protein
MGRNPTGAQDDADAHARVGFLPMASNPSGDYCFHMRTQRFTGFKINRSAMLFIIVTMFSLFYLRLK